VLNHRNKIQRCSFGTKELNAEQKPGLSFLGHFGLSPTILRIRLSELRKQMGVKQEDIRAFTQSGISKLESRKDMKLSTLVEYLQNIGMGLEIKAYPKKGKHKADEVVLLKI